MITDKDVQKLKKDFVTKKYSEIFATKKDLKKVEKNLNAKIETIIQNYATRHELHDLREIVEVQGTKMDKILSMLDGLCGRFDILETEYWALSSITQRHEKWHHQTAECIGIKFDY